MKSADIKQWYLSNFELFEDHINGSKDFPFHRVRGAAMARFSELGFPTPKNEEWKYTNVSSLLGHRFKLATSAVDVDRDSYSDFLFDGLSDNLLVFVNGHFAKTHSQIHLAERSVIVDGLSNAAMDHKDLINRHLSHYINFENECFTALNTAFTNDGAFIFVPDNVVVESPVHILNLTLRDDKDLVAHPRNLFVIGKNSQVSIIESYHALDDGPYFSNPVTEVVVGENARVDHIKLQEEGESAYHISNTQVRQERDSVYTTVNIDLGGSLVRNNLNILLNAENCEAHLFGFFMGFGRQHIDNHTFIDHAMPHCFSNELYKGILDESAKGVFNGKILVRPDAQKTNALQSNKTLLLTNNASINAKPQLEIFADDVKCTHGATIGQLDDEALFYLRSRGIPEEMAGAMLRHAFISDVLDNIKVEAVRTKMDRHIIERYSRQHTG